jgi:hypothetical protein
MNVTCILSFNSRTDGRFRISYKTLRIMKMCWTGIGTVLIWTKVWPLKDYRTFISVFTARCNVNMFPVGWCDTDNWTTCEVCQSPGSRSSLHCSLTGLRVATPRSNHVPVLGATYFVDACFVILHCIGHVFWCMHKSALARLINSWINYATEWVVSYCTDRANTISDIILPRVTIYFSLY